MHETWIPIENDPILPAALAALGFTVKPVVHITPGAASQAAHKKVTWNVSPQSADELHDARILVPAYKDKTLHKESPNHPLLAGIYAIKTLMVLQEWKRGLIPMPHVVRIKGLAVAIPATTNTQGYDISPHLAGPTESMPMDHAAAAITCGHGLFGISSHGCYVTSRGAFSPMVPAATLAAAAAQVASNPRMSASLAIGGAEKGEHPFLYALAAISQAKALRAQAEAKDPTLQLTSRSGKVALVSQSIMEGPSSFKEHVHKHLR